MLPCHGSISTRNVGNNLQINKPFKIFQGSPSHHLARSPRLSQSAGCLSSRSPVAPRPSGHCGMLPAPQPPERDRRVLPLLEGALCQPPAAALGALSCPAEGPDHPASPRRAAGESPASPGTQLCPLGSEMNRDIRTLQKQAVWLPAGQEKARLPCGGQEPFPSLGCQAPNTPEVSLRARQHPGAWRASTAQLWGTKALRTKMPLSRTLFCRK